MELIFKTPELADDFCKKFTAIRLDGNNVHFEHSEYKKLPEIGTKVIDRLAPYGVTGTKLGSSIDATKWTNINKTVQPVVVSNQSIFGTVCDFVPVETSGNGAITLLKSVNTTVEIEYKDIPKDVIKKLQELVIESCTSVIKDLDERNLFIKQFDVEKVFQDNDCALSVGLNKVGEKVFWFFLDSYRFRYADDYFINEDFSLFCVEPYGSFEY